MPPKRLAGEDVDDDDDDDYVVSQETLDDRFWRAVQGGELATLGGEVENSLPMARRMERVRARSRLQCDVLRPEQVRRILRRSGVLVYATTSPDDGIILTRY